MRISNWSSDVCSSDLFGAQGAGGGDHALGLAAAEPEAAVGVEVAEVAHAVDDAGTSARCARALTPTLSRKRERGQKPSPACGRGLGEGALLTDLRQPRLCIPVEVRVGGGAAGDRDLAHLAGLHAQPVRPSPNGGLADAYDAPARTCGVLGPSVAV